MSFVFETERLLLRTLKIEDIDEVMKFWGKEEVMEYCYGTSSREHIEKVQDIVQNLIQKAKAAGITTANDESYSR